MQQISKKVAFGTLLFGGVLGVAAPANADLTWTYANIYLDASSASNWIPADLNSALAGGSAVASDSSLTLTPFSQSGFTLSSSASSGVWSIYAFTLNFTVDTATTISLSGNTAADSAFIGLVDLSTNSAIFTRFSGDASAWASGDITLQAGGSYSLIINPGGLANGGTDTGTVLSFAVPAPGAAALVGLAGLMARRRRA